MLTQFSDYIFFRCGWWQMLVRDEYITSGAPVIIALMRHPFARILSISTSFTCWGIRSATMRQSRGQIVIIGSTRLYCKLVRRTWYFGPPDSILIVTITGRNSEVTWNVDVNNNIMKMFVTASLGRSQFPFDSMSSRRCFYPPEICGRMLLFRKHFDAVAAADATACCRYRRYPLLSLSTLPFAAAADATPCCRILGLR